MEDKKVVNFNEVDEIPNDEYEDDYEEEIEETIGDKIKKTVPVLKTVGKIAAMGCAMVVGFLICSAFLGEDDSAEIEEKSDGSFSVKDSMNSEIKETTNIETGEF